MHVPSFESISDRDSGRNHATTLKSRKKATTFTTRSNGLPISHGRMARSAWEAPPTSVLCSGSPARPPHLAALMPYDGMSDLDREIVVHGGIPNPGFVSFWNL